MEIWTTDGIIIYSLPDYACCKCVGVSPEALTECPLRKFDAFGDKCFPELCEEYTEERNENNA